MNNYCRYASIILLFLLAGLPVLAQPVLVKDIHPGTASGLDDYPTPVAVLGSQLLFAGTDGSNGASFQLWKSDGTPAGTVLVKNINTNPLNGVLDFYTTYKDHLYFLGRDDASTGIELWRTDGTEAGTKIVRDACPGTCSVFYGFYAPEYAVFDNRLFFQSEDNSLGEELFVTDGGDPTLFKDIYPGFFDGSPGEMAVMGNKLYFSADGQGVSRELWATDGTPGGTQLVKDIIPGAFSGSSPSDLFPVGNTLYFVATTFEHGSELWKTDGTEAGTVLVKDINPGSASGLGDVSQRGFAALGNTLLFLADNGMNGVELWRTDGTEAGTQLVKDICFGGCNSLARFMGQINGKQLFVADDPANGSELWVTDGTPAGTNLVKDIFPGFLGSNIFPDFAVFNNRMIFNANDNVNGNELWITDGTPAGTALLADVRPGAAGSSPRSLRLVGNTLFFTASQPDTGRELWRYDLVPPTAVINVSTDTSCVASPIQFTATPVPGALEYRWLFGQGASPTIATGTGPHNVSFNSAGVKNVRLIVRNIFGADTVFQPIQILPLPAANFTFTTDGNTVTFTNTSNNAVSYLWTFGDGATGTDPNPVHTYPGAGSYPVKLRAQNLCGFSEITLTVVISVGLDEPLATAAWRLAPNPAAADFALRLDGAPGGEALQLELFDALGRPVYRTETTWFSDGQTVDFRGLGLAPGTYRLVVHHNGSRMAEYGVVVR